ncbi:MAG: GIY-YIG nuclease family protein [Candidatus Uhrbacteria bacterium]
MAKWTVYMLRCSDDSLYTGMTNNLQSRVKKHNAGTASRYTRSRLPVELVWSEECESETQARKHEYVIKKLSKVEKEEMVR